MDISDLLYGSLGRIVATFSIIVIVLMMFLVSLRLYLSRRKKAYFSFAVSLLIIMIQYLLMSVWEVSNRSTDTGSGYWAQLLQVLAFILMNMGIYQLYNASRRREFVLFYFFLSITVAIGALRFYFIRLEADPTVQFVHFHNMWIEVYLLFLTFLSFYLIAPNVGQHIKYQFSLTVYFLVQAAHILNAYVLNQELAVFSAAENFLPIIYYITLFMIIFERVVELLQAVYTSAITDGLTGLFNRHYLINRIHQYVKEKRNISLIFGDIDNFKKLNDTKGHQTGDKILKQVAGIMKEESEDIGMAGRYGGEEMVIVLTDTSLRVENLAEQVRKRVETETGITISLGYSKYRNGMSAEELIMQADQAMYHSKKSGKNKVTGFPQKSLAH